MDSVFRINGPCRLSGEMSASGDKNTALKLIPASLLTSDPVVLRNVPDIADVRAMLSILEHLGGQYTFTNNVLRIDNSQVTYKKLPSEIASKIRGSLLFAGPMLTRFGKCELAYPGGCVLGKRPIDSHLYGFTCLGVKIDEDNNGITFQAPKGGMKGGLVRMKELSVTATENVLMAAIGANGETEMRLCAREPSVADLVSFLRKMGLEIKGRGSSTMKIQGWKGFGGVTHTVIPDRIEVGTFVAAAVATKGDVTIHNINPRHMDAVWVRLDEMNANYTLGKNWVRVHGTQKLEPINKLDTRTYPGFPTDLHPPFVVPLLQANGTSRVFETLFESRFSYLYELQNMKAKIDILNPHQAKIHGSSELKGGSISSCDLRAGGTLVLAGLVAQGETLVHNINYIDRGYERFEEKMKQLGADIDRVVIG